MANCSTMVGDDKGGITDKGKAEGKVEYAGMQGKLHGGALPECLSGAWVVCFARLLSHRKQFQFPGGIPEKQQAEQADQEDDACKHKPAQPPVEGCHLVEQGDALP